jgi:hypothetical protein
MKYNWLGRRVVESDSGPANYVLVVMTPKNFDDEMKNKVSGITGLTMLDVKIRFHANGFFIVSHADDAQSLGDIGQKLKDSGITPFIFNKSEAFDIPEIMKSSSCRLGGGAITLSSNLNGKEISFGSSSYLLVVKGRIQVDTQHAASHIAVSNSRSPVGITSSTLSQSQYSESKKIFVVNIYDLFGNNAVQLLDGRFNFKDAFKDSTPYNFKANADLLLKEMEKVTSHISVDELFEHSSLPSPEREMNVSHEGVCFNSTLNVSIVSKTTSETNAFDQYSRFRYIIEQRLSPDVKWK